MRHDGAEPLRLIQLLLKLRDIRKATPSASFTLAPSDLVSAGVARIALKASTDFYEIGFEANGRIANRYESGSAQFTVRVLF